MKKNFYQVGGSLPPHSLSYVKRDADDKLFDYLKEGEYCYILNARQVGKSSLCIHTSKRLDEQGYTCINIDLSSIGSENITVNQWYYSFIYQVIEQLQLNENAFFQWWNEHSQLTVINRFAKVFDKFILKDNQKEIIIFIDEIDSILGIKKDFSTDDFFAVIRSFYNLRSRDEKYKKITFVLLGVATPEELMKDSSRTPFNIAKNIQLDLFKLHSSTFLLGGLENQILDKKEILKKIFDWSGGMPYLTQKILNYVSKEPLQSLEDIDKIVNILFIHESFKETNISNIQNRILKNEFYNIKMLFLINELIDNKTIKIHDDTNFEQIYLKLSGLVKEENSELKYTNEIYKNVFNEVWLKEAFNKIDRPFMKDLQRWLKLNKTNSALLKGEILEEANKWSSERKDLNSDEHEYLRLSSLEEQKNKLQKEAFKKKSKTITLLSILLTISIIVMYFYVDLQNKEEKVIEEKNKIIKHQERLLIEKEKIIKVQKTLEQEIEIRIEQKKIIIKQKLKIEKLEKLVKKLEIK